MKEIQKITNDPRQLFHIAATCLVLLASYPLTRLAKLEVTGGPLRLMVFLPTIIAQGISLSALLFVIQSPNRAIFTIRAGKTVRFFFIVPAVALLIVLNGWYYGVFLSFGAVGVAEYLCREDISWREALVACGVPAIYFLVGFGLVYSFNDIIATFRFYGACDSTLRLIDSHILCGGSVADITEWFQVHTGEWTFRFADALYFGAFAQIGAGIIFVGISSGLSRAIRLVGTLLLAYYVGLLWFFLWPSHGPYLNSLVTIPKSLWSYRIQQLFLVNAATLWHHVDTLPSSGGYYVSFPCLHIAQPLIILWYLRRYRKIARFLGAYDLVLILAILVLQWHYVVDILGGFVLASIVLFTLNPLQRRSQESDLVERN